MTLPGSTSAVRPLSAMLKAPVEAIRQSGNARQAGRCKDEQAK